MGYPLHSLDSAIAGIKRAGCLQRALWVRVVDGSDQYEVCPESVVDYIALTHMPSSHPARDNVPVNIIE